jgi:hypothetical protein
LEVTREVKFKESTTTRTTTRTVARLIWKKPIIASLFRSPYGGALSLKLRIINNS